MEGKGHDYAGIPQTILVSILDFDLFDCGDYHSEFELLETSRHESLSDRLKAVFYELRKIGPLDRDDMLSLWLHLLKAESTEELDEIRGLGVDIMDRAVRSVQEIQEDRRLRHLALRRDMAEHDAAQDLYDARREGLEEGLERARRDVVLRMYASGFDTSPIAQATGYGEQRIRDIIEGRD